MTRDELLARVRLDRTDARAQTWLGAAIGAALALGGGLYARKYGLTPGPVLALTAGAAVILVVIGRLTTPKPSYAGGRLEARATPMGAVVALAFLAAVAAATAYALSAEDLWRRGELLAALAFVVVLMLVNWGLALGPAPVVTIDGDGFHDRRATRGPIPWDELEPVDTQWVRNQAYYRVRPKDLSRLTWLARLNLLVGFPGFALNGVGLDHGEGDMLLAIHAFRPDLVGNI